MRDQSSVTGVEQRLRRLAITLACLALTTACTSHNPAGLATPSTVAPPAPASTVPVVTAPPTTSLPTGVSLFPFAVRISGGLQRTTTDLFGNPYPAGAVSLSLPLSITNEQSDRPTDKYTTGLMLDVIIPKADTAYANSQATFCETGDQGPSIGVAPNPPPVLNLGECALVFGVSASSANPVQIPAGGTGQFFGVLNGTVSQSFPLADAKQMVLISRAGTSLQKVASTRLAIP